MWKITTTDRCYMQDELNQKRNKFGSQFNFLWMLKFREGWRLESGRTYRLCNNCSKTIWVFKEIVYGHFCRMPSVFCVAPPIKQCITFFQMNWLKFTRWNQLQSGKRNLKAIFQQCQTTMQGWVFKYCLIIILWQSCFIWGHYRGSLLILLNIMVA